MPKADDKQMAVAQVYGRAMHDLAVSRGEADALEEELGELAAQVEANADLADFFASPLIDVRDRRQGLEKLFRGKASELLVDSLQVINRKGRLELVGAIAEAYHLLHQAELGRVDVQVTTAVALGPAQRDRLTSALKQHTGRQPQLIERVEPSLVGGMVLRIEDEKFDDSVSHQISLLHKKLHQRAEREIHRARRAAAG